MSCAVETCARPVECRGWCSMHYRRWRRTGSPLGRAGITPAERFTRFHAVAESGCWLWTGGLDTSGYGIFDYQGRSVRAHRWAYTHYRGQVAPGLVLDHLCRVRHCVNPDHLEPVTNRENALRGQGFAAVNAVKTHCPQGHPYDEANTIWYAGRRYCRGCRAA